MRLTLERVFFSADYPFETMQDVADWYDSTSVVSAEDYEKIARSNAVELVNLDLE